MTETITNALVQWFGGHVPKELIVFLISLLPVLELRGGLIASKLLGVPLLRAFVICYIGNLLPIPLILLFIRRVFSFLKRFRHSRRLVEWLERHSEKKSETVMRLRSWGLLLLVAIPLPGTGGWTGALVAALMDLPMRTSLPIIALGVLIAGVIVAAFSYGLLGALGIG